MQSLKKQFPFRLGTTSYIIEDNLVANAGFLGPLVDDIELVLFEWDGVSNIPDRKTIESLSRLKEEHGISYTVHMPSDTELGSFDEVIRKRSTEKCLEIIELTTPLDPFAYIIHFHGEMRGRIPVRNLPRWLESLDASAARLVESGLDPKMLCVESLDYPYELIEPIVSKYDMSICLDAGHLVFFDYPLSDYLDKYLERSRVVHLHGHCDGMDHKDIGMLEQEVLETLSGRASLDDKKERVLTLEVFGLSDFEHSMDAMRWLRHRKKSL